MRFKGGFFLGVSYVAFMALSSPAAADAVKGAFEQCRAIVQPDRRLNCYDNLDLERLASSNQPRFAGKRTVKTDMFTITEPTVLRYHSDGAIFVLALHDKQDNIVQNLHIGGGGEDTYLIEVPGDYYLRVNGSTTWRIWLDKP